MPSKSVIACAHALVAKDLSISFAESASTGRLVYDFTSVPECGSAVKGSIVCYDRSVKENLMNIPAELIDKYTPESAEVTKLLADSLKVLIPADVIVAVTGLASEGGSETEEKPVGTMFAHGYVRDEEWMYRFNFDGTPDEIIAKTADAVATLLLEKISNIS